jgi:uncharacterized membrane protein YdbT with pleckstrin-like domain
MRTLGRFVIAAVVVTLAAALLVWQAWPWWTWIILTVGAGGLGRLARYGYRPGGWRRG